MPADTNTEKCHTQSEYIISAINDVHWAEITTNKINEWHSLSTHLMRVSVSAVSNVALLLAACSNCRIDSTIDNCTDIKTQNTSNLMFQK